MVPHACVAPWAAVRCQWWGNVAGLHLLHKGMCETKFWCQTKTTCMCSVATVKCNNNCTPFTPIKPCACMPITLQWMCFLRQVLLTSGVWGSVDESVQVRLHRAYLAFKTWCSRNRIQCSQPAFNQKMVTWQLCPVIFLFKGCRIFPLSTLAGHTGSILITFVGISPLCCLSCCVLLTRPNPVVHEERRRHACLQSLQWPCGCSMAK